MSKKQNHYIVFSISVIKMTDKLIPTLKSKIYFNYFEFDSCTFGKYVAAILSNWVNSNNKVILNFISIKVEGLRNINLAGYFSNSPLFLYKIFSNRLKTKQISSIPSSFFIANNQKHS